MSEYICNECHKQYAMNKIPPCRFVIDTWHGKPILCPIAPQLNANWKDITSQNNYLPIKPLKD